jgi:GntP family gluconate:H+ symporter
MTVIALVLSVVLIIVLTTRLSVHPFFSLLLVALAYGIVTGMPLDMIIASINDGFGNTLGKIGLIIVFGVVIGAFLENTGGAYALADRVLKIIGRKRVSVAMGIVGYFISIPVFADSGFLLVAPLNKTLSKKAGISLAGSAVALGLGLTATHTMVPPTPGPIAAAGILGADLGLVMMLGLPISALALIPCLVYSTKYVSRTYIDPAPDVTEAEIDERMKDAPRVFKSSLPIVVPILLIVLKSVIDYLGVAQNTYVHDAISFVGEPIIALLIGTALSLLLPRKLKSEMLSTEGWIGKAMKSAATIILVTGAGGIFGKVLQNSGIAKELGDTLVRLNMSIWLPFLLAAAIKTAQGSSTVSLITTASILLPMMTPLGFVTEMQKAMVVIAIGAGSAVVSHANDSFFWVVTQLTGMKVKAGYKLFTLGTLVLGVSAALVVFLGYLILT